MGIFELFISAIFVNNIVLSQNLGNCPYIGCSKEKGVALGMGGAVIFVIVLATIFTWLAQKYILAFEYRLFANTYFYSDYRFPGAVR